MIELNLDTSEEPRIMKASGLLNEEQGKKLVELIKKYQDCITWDYHQMLGLSKELVEHY